MLGSEKIIEYKGKFTVADIKKGLNCLKNAGEYLGAENIIYRAAIKGINSDLNTDIEEAFTNAYFNLHIIIFDLKFNCNDDILLVECFSNGLLKKEIENLHSQSCIKTTHNCIVFRATKNNNFIKMSAYAFLRNDVLISSLKSYEVYV